MTVNNDPGVCYAVVNYAAPVASDNCSGYAVVQYGGLPSGSNFNVGLTVNRFRVTDSGGNTATCAFNITVKDIEAPTITCPANITTYARQTLCSQIVDYSVPYTDNCTGTVTFNYSHPPKYAFVKGVTTVTVSAQDQSNNIAFCTFTVTVFDTVKPTPNCVTRTDSVITGTACAKNVTFNMTAIDNCSGVVKTYTPPSGSVFTVGTTPVLFVVTDAVGNSASCTFNVVLLDRVKPNVVCKNKTISLNTQTSYTLLNADVIQSSSDNCGVATRVINPNPITCAHASPTIVTVTVTDIYGNAKTCTSTITINGRNACGGGAIVGSEENGVNPQTDENNIPETASERLVSNAIHVIPNPVIDNMEVLFDLPVTDGTITIYDAFGKIIQRMELESGVTSLSLNVSDEFVWKGGMYYAQLSSQGQLYTKGFIITK